MADRDLEAVRDQMARSVGASFGPVQSFTKTVTFARRTSTVDFRRTTTTRGTPFIEVVSASDPLWGRPGDPPSNLTAAVWVVDDVAGAETQLVAAGTKFLARVSGELASYEGVDGQLFGVVRRDLVADPATATANTPPTGVVDLGRMHHFSRAVRPQDHSAATAQLTAAVGMQWGPHSSFADIVYAFPHGRTAVVDHPDQQFSAPGTHSRPYYDLISASPPIAPWNARVNRAPASMTWATSDMAGATIQFEAAGMKPVVTLDLDLPGFFTGRAIVYFEGVGGIDLQLLHRAFAPG